MLGMDGSFAGAGQHAPTACSDGMLRRHAPTACSDSSSEVEAKHERHLGAWVDNVVLQESASVRWVELFEADAIQKPWAPRTINRARLQALLP